MIAREFAIRSLAEASAYLSHSTLGPRYLECVSALQHGKHVSARAVLGDVDATKLRSSLTLFELAGAHHVVSETLDRWYDGTRDSMTLDIIRQSCSRVNV